MGKNHIVFDPADLTESDTIGSYTLAGDDGAAIGHVSDSLKVNVTNTITATINAAYAEDTAAVSGDFLVGAGVQRHDANTSTVSADGDYSLLHVNSLGGLKTSIMGANGNDLLVNADGSINANVDVSVTTGSDKAEDSASANADIGTFILGVRQDTLATSTSTDGDYGAIKTDARGAMWTAPVGFVADDAADGGQFSVKVGGVARANTAALDLADAGDKVDMITDLARRLFINQSYTQGMLSTLTATVTDTAAALLGAQLANRKKVRIDNLGGKDVFVGDATVQGILVPKQGYWEDYVGPAISLFAKVTTGASNALVYVTEFA